MDSEFPKRLKLKIYSYLEVKEIFLKVAKLSWKDWDLLPNSNLLKDRKPMKLTIPRGFTSRSILYYIFSFHTEIDVRVRIYSSFSLVKVFLNKLPPKFNDRKLKFYTYKSKKCLH